MTQPGELTRGLLQVAKSAPPQQALTSGSGFGAALRFQPFADHEELNRRLPRYSEELKHYCEQARRAHALDIPVLS